MNTMFNTNLTASSSCDSPSSQKTSQEMQQLQQLFAGKQLLPQPQLGVPITPPLDTPTQHTPTSLSSMLTNLPTSDLFVPPSSSIQLLSSQQNLSNLGTSSTNLSQELTETNIPSSDSTNMFSTSMSSISLETPTSTISPAISTSNSQILPPYHSNHSSTFTPLSTEQSSGNLVQPLIPDTNTSSLTLTSSSVLPPTTYIPPPTENNSPLTTQNTPLNIQSLPLTLFTAPPNASIPTPTFHTPSLTEQAPPPNPPVPLSPASSISSFVNNPPSSSNPISVQDQIGDPSLPSLQTLTDSTNSPPTIQTPQVNMSTTDPILPQFTSTDVPHSNNYENFQTSQSTPLPGLPSVPSTFSQPSVVLSSPSLSSSTLTEINDFSTTATPSSDACAPSETSSLAVVSSILSTNNSESSIISPDLPLTSSKQFTSDSNTYQSDIVTHISGSPSEIIDPPISASFQGPSSEIFSYDSKTTNLSTSSLGMLAAMFASSTSSAPPSTSSQAGLSNLKAFLMENPGLANPSFTHQPTSYSPTSTPPQNYSIPPPFSNMQFSSSSNPSQFTSLYANSTIQPTSTQYTPTTPTTNYNVSSSDTSNLSATISQSNQSTMPSQPPHLTLTNLLGINTTPPSMYSNTGGPIMNFPNDKGGFGEDIGAVQSNIAKPYQGSNNTHEGDNGSVEFVYSRLCLYIEKSEKNFVFNSSDLCLILHRYTTPDKVHICEDRPAAEIVITNMDGAIEVPQQLDKIHLPGIGILRCIILKRGETAYTTVPSFLGGKRSFGEMGAEGGFDGDMYLMKEKMGRGGMYLDHGEEDMNDCKIYPPGELSESVNNEFEGNKMVCWLELIDMFCFEPEFNITQLLLGSNGQNMEHVINKTHNLVEVNIQGKPIDSAPYEERLHLLIVSEDLQAYKRAVELLESLINSIIQQFVHYSETRHLPCPKTAGFRRQEYRENLDGSLAYIGTTFDSRRASGISASSNTGLSAYSSSQTGISTPSSAPPLPYSHHTNSSQHHQMNIHNSSNTLHTNQSDSNMYTPHHVHHHHTTSMAYNRRSRSPSLHTPHRNTSSHSHHLGNNRRQHTANSSLNVSSFNTPHNRSNSSNNSLHHRERRYDSPPPASPSHSTGGPNPNHSHIHSNQLNNSNNSRTFSSNSQGRNSPSHHHTHLSRHSNNNAIRRDIK